MQQGHGADSTLHVLQNFAAVRSRVAPIFKAQQARNHLQVVLDPVMHFAQQAYFFLQQCVLGGLCLLPVVNLVLQQQCACQYLFFKQGMLVKKRTVRLLRFNQIADPHQQLGTVKRFGNEIPGTGLQRTQQMLMAALRGQNQNGRKQGVAQ